MKNASGFPSSTRWKNDGTGSTEEEYPFPERKGLILPERLNRHHSGLSLPSLQQWVTTGILPDNTKALPADASPLDRLCRIPTT